jgi:type I restriction enzyme S subunit
MVWNESTLGEICDAGQGLIKTGPFGSQLHQSDYSDTGTPVVMPKDIIGGRVSEASIARVSEEHVDRLSHHQLRPGDIVYGRRGDIGRCALVTPTESGWLCGTGCLKIHLGDGEVSSQFLFYHLNHPRTVAWILNQAIGATMPNLNTGILRSIPVRYPDRDIQARISSVLSAYDDLIDNNSRRIEILEEMARRLYEEWFVHFRFPGHEEASFKEGELGRIPEGWEVQELGNVAQVNPEAIKPKSAPDEVHYIDIASVSPGRIDKAETMQFSDAPGRARRIVRFGDVLWSCVRPNRRSCAMVVEPKKDTVASTGFAVLRAESISKHYLYQYVRADQFVSYLVNRATGAAYPAVKASDFKEAMIIVPQGDVLSHFDKAVAPMRSLIHRWERKNANLRAQRDLLLPKLVSGEIDVSEISVPEDKEVEAA